MRPRFPAPLHPGARIAITAPCSGVAPGHHARLDRALDALRAGWAGLHGPNLMELGARAELRWQDGAGSLRQTLA